LENLFDSLVGRRVGNYIVSSVLQEGGMGTVYLAEHPEIGRRVAIKVLPREQGDLAGVAERFIVEARAIARIDHPNVIEIYDFGRTADGQLYYIMELLSGRELAELMSERGSMGPEEISQLLPQICAGLQAAHDTGVVHRDLKPENIFLDERGITTVKILDFGIAKLLETHPASKGPSITQAGMVMGTPYTIAPEQAAGRPDQIGPHTDIYSLGAILYWMLAGAPPFMAEPTAVLLAQHITDSPPPLAQVDPQIPASVAALVERCLSKLPSERPSSALEVSRLFEQAMRSAVAATHSDGASLGLSVSGQREGVMGPHGSGADTVAESSGTDPLAEGERSNEVERRGDADRPGGASGTGAQAADTVAEPALPMAMRMAAIAKREQPPARSPRARGAITTTVGAPGHLGWRWALIGSIALAIVFGTVLAMSGDDSANPPGPGHATSAGARERARGAHRGRSAERGNAPDGRRPRSVSHTASRRDGAGDGAGLAMAAEDAPYAAAGPPTDAAGPPADAAPLREIEVSSEMDEARCQFSLDGVELPEIPVPCRMEVPVGSRLRLSVAAEGYQRYERSWTVQRAEALSVALVPRMPQVEPPASKPTRRKKAVRSRSKRRSKAVRRRKARERLGAGMMDF
jgi:serine/threonine protein kinase